MAVTHSDVSSVTSVNVAADPFTETQKTRQFAVSILGVLASTTWRNQAGEQMNRNRQTQL